MIYTAIFSVTVLALIGGTDVHAEKSCMRGSESCAQLKNDAKKVFKAILAGPKEDHEAEVLTLLEQVQGLFAAMGRVDCRIEVCTCPREGNLQCGLFAEKLRSREAESPLPDCLRRSTESMLTHQRFKTAILSDDNQGIADAIALLRGSIVSGLRPREPILACLKTSMRALRKFLKHVAKSSGMQKNCDFCREPATWANK